MKDFTWGGRCKLFGGGVVDLVCSHFWGGTYGTRKKLGVSELGGVVGGGGTEAPALLGCTVILVLRCYVKLNFYLTLNYVSWFKKVYIH